MSCIKRNSEHTYTNSNKPGVLKNVLRRKNSCFKRKSEHTNTNSNKPGVYIIYILTNSFKNVCILLLLVVLRRSSISCHKMF